MKIFVDFESRSAVDIKNFGGYIYSRHWSTEITAVSIRDAAGGLLYSWHLGCGEDLDLRLIADENNIIYGHNVFFEYCMYNFCAAEKCDVPQRLDTLSWRCTQAMLRTHALPGALESGAKALGLAQEKADNRHMLKLSRPRSLDFDGVVWWPVDKELSEYCNQDTLVSNHIYKRLGDLTPINASMFQETLRVNTRGIRVDIPLAENCMRIIEYERAGLLAEGLKLGVANAKSVQQMLQRLKIFGLELGDLRADTVSEALGWDSISPEARKLLDIRQAVARSSTAKFKAMVDLADEDERVRGLFRYHGATTGRWSSTGVQLQNLPRGAADPDLYAAVKAGRLTDALELARAQAVSFNTASVKLVRACFIPAEGCKFLCSDFGQIETRVLYWLAGMHEELDLLRRGLCVYKHMAGKIYGLADPQSMSADDPMRQVGKVAVLGLGYQMGAERFAFENKMPMDLAEKIVGLFRKTPDGRYTKIPQLWFQYERAMRSCILSGNSKQVGPVVFTRDKDFAYIRMPSGRKISYYHPSVDDEGKVSYYAVDSQTATFRKTSTYGGKLCENIVQGAALCLMAGALDRLEAYKYPVVLTAHDEALVEVPYDFGSLDEVNEIMVDAPSWAQGIPLIANGWEGQYYRK